MKNVMKKLVIAVLRAEARVVLWRFRPFIIGVTGSVGKTSTKDAIAGIIGHIEGGRNVRASYKSQNSEIGIPLTVLGLENAWGSPLGWLWNILRGALSCLALRYPKILILEVGADMPGDITALVSWLPVDIVVLTRLPDIPVHVANYSSAQAVRDEEAALLLCLRPSGKVVMNGDDPNIMALRKNMSNHMMTYGFGALSAIRGTDVRVYGEEIGEYVRPKGLAFAIEWKGESWPIRIPGVAGEQLATSVLAGVATALTLEYEFDAILHALLYLSTPPGRMRLIEGINDSTIIDDSYNASPVAMEAALATLSQLQKVRTRYVVLGDMLELGEYSEAEHQRIGGIVANVADELCMVGKRSVTYGVGAKEAGMHEEAMRSFESPQEAGKWVADRLASGDVVLVKGSQGSGANAIRTERAVKEMMVHPEEAHKLLVRQEKEWLKR